MAKYDDDLKRATRVIEAYLRSPQGSKALDDTSAQAQETIRRLQESRKICWDDLNKPICAEGDR